MTVWQRLVEAFWDSLWGILLGAIAVIGWVIGSFRWIHRRLESHEHRLDAITASMRARDELREKDREQLKDDINEIKATQNTILAHLLGKR